MNRFTDTLALKAAAELDFAKKIEALGYTIAASSSADYSAEAGYFFVSVSVRIPVQGVKE
jgi:hypothetical protein